MNDAAQVVFHCFAGKSPYSAGIPHPSAGKSPYSERNQIKGGICVIPPFT